MRKCTLVLTRIMNEDLGLEIRPAGAMPIQERIEEATDYSAVDTLPLQQQQLLTNSQFWRIFFLFAFFLPLAENSTANHVFFFNF
uniref:Uncharacterized protein n=1 Tax=Centropages dorsispinatus TaxID=1239308 RepID=A0A0U2UTN7_9MAXI|nr:hypothetical protein [Centropages dorsispinatus]